MSTKKLQLIGTINASDADTLDGKHAEEFALATDLSTLQDLVGDKPILEQIDEAVSDIGFIDINLEGSNVASPNPINADTLGGHNIDSLVELVADSLPDVDVTITVDAELDTTSENPIQNTVVATAINTVKTQISSLDASDIAYKDGKLSEYMFIALTQEEYNTAVAEGTITENTPYLIIEG